MIVTDMLNTGLRRISPRLVYLGLLLPLGWYIYLAFTGGLGFEPVETLEHGFGQIALWLLLAGLAVTPLRRMTGLTLMRQRRAIGVMAFVYAVLHVLVWAVLDTGGLAEILREIQKRPYITIGMASFAMLLPLALTSNNWSMRTLGRKWRSLHKLVYLAVPLAALHFVMLRKGFQIEPILYLLGALALVLFRLPKGRLTRLVR